MFCSKCGNEIAEGAAFCSKCGTKIYKEGEVPQQPGDPAAADEVLPDKDGMAQTNAGDNEAQTTSSNLDEFRKFVDDYVQKNTVFHTAEELLNSRVPLKFAWICFGVPLALAFINIALGLFALLIGYLTAMLISWLKKGRYAFKLSGKIEGAININELVLFLNEYLGHVLPYFHEWGYLQKSGFGVQGVLLTSLGEFASEAAKEIRLCTELGEQGRQLSVIYIRPSLANPDSGQLEYFFDAEDRISGFPFISHDWGFAKYKCVVKTGPILQAAMEYYLNIYK